MKKTQKHIQKRILLITLAILFTLTIIGISSAATYTTSTDLTISHNSATPGDNVTLTANIDRYRLPLGPTSNAPAGIPVTFRNLDTHTDIGTNITDSNGIAYYTYHVTSSVSLEAQVVAGRYNGDNYASSFDHEPLEVHSTSTSISVSPNPTTVGNSVTLSSRLTPDGSPLEGRTIHFMVDGVQVGTSTTNSNGWAYLYTYSPSSSGTKNIQAVFYGYLDPAGFLDDWDYYLGSNGGTTLNVNGIPTTLAVTSPSGYNGTIVPITATLTRNNDNAPISGASVSITVNGQTYTNSTNGAGQITWNFLINNLFAMDYPIQATYGGNGTYVGTTGTGTLTVLPSAHVKLTKTASNPIKYWNLVTFTITAHNNGLDNAQGVEIRDILPSGLTFVSADTHGVGSFNSGVWTIPNLANGANAILTIVANVTGTGTITNWANVTAQTTHDSFAFNTTSVTINVPAASVITISKEWRATRDGLAIPQANYLDNVFVVIIMRNDGPNMGIVTVQDIFPAGFTPSNVWYWMSTNTDPTWHTVSTAWPGSWPNTWVHEYDTLYFAIPGQITATGVINNTANITAQSTYNPLYPGGAPYGNANALLNVPPAAHVTVNKIVNNSNPNYLSQVTFTVTAHNNGPNTAQGLQITDLLPAGLVYISDTGLGTYNSTSGVWNIGSLANGTDAILSITALVNATGSFTNWANVTAQTTHDISPWSKDNETITVPAAAHITVTKTASNPAPNYHSLVTFTITAHNNGPDAAQNIQITDLLPAGLTFVSADTFGIGTFNLGIWTIPNLANGTDAVLNITANVTGTGAITNWANVTSQPNDYLPLDKASVTINVPGASIITMTKEFRRTLDGSAIPMANNIAPVINYLDTVYAVFTATNTGPNHGTFWFSDTPEGFTVQGTQFWWKINGGSWQFGWFTSNLPISNYGFSFGQGDTLSVALLGQITSTGTINNTANETSQDTTHPGPLPSATAQLIIPTAADLSVIKDVDDNTPDIEQMIMYTITAFNNGPNNATGVRVIDNLPAGVRFDHASSTDYDPSTDVWNVGDIEAGHFKQLLIYAIVNAHPTSPSYTNIASISGTEYDWNLTNNNDSETITMPQATITLAKEFRNSTWNVIDTAHYHNWVWTIIKAHNYGPNNATNVSIQDVLPAGLTPDYTNIWLSTDSGINWALTSNYTGNIWNIANLPNGTEYWLRIWTQVTSTGDKINQANVTQLDQYYTSLGTASATLHVPQEADMSITKTFEDTDHNLIYNEDYLHTVVAHLTVTNNGPDAANGVQIYDYLPEDFNLSAITSDAPSGIWTSLYYTSTRLLTITFSSTIANGTTYNFWFSGFNLGHNNTNITNTAFINNTALQQYDPDLDNNNSTAWYIANAAADVAVTKTFENTSGGHLNNADYLQTVVTHLTMANHGPDTAYGVTINDIIPAELDISTLQITSNAPMFSWIRAYVPATRQLSIIFLNPILNGTTYDFWLNLTNIGHNNALVINSADVNPASLPQYDWNPVNNHAIDTYTANTAADIAVTKIWENNSGTHIDNANYLSTVIAHLTVTNNGPDIANGVQIYDIIPAEFVFNLADITSDAPAGSWTSAFNSGLLTITFNNAIVNGTSYNFWIPGINIGHNNTLVNNNAFVNTTTLQQYDWDPNNNNSTDSYNANAAADVSIAKEFRTDYQNSSSTTNNANYHTPIWALVHVTNNGPDAAANLQITDILPAGLTFQNVYHVSHDNGTTWTATDIFNSGIWTIGDMPNGTDYWLAILAQVDGHNTTVENVANKTQITFDWNDTNDEGRATLNIPPAADVFVKVTQSKSKLTVGETMVVRVKVGNNGPDSAQNVIVTYKVPAGMEYVSLNWESGYPAPTYDPVSRTVTWNLGDLGVIDPWMDITLRAVGTGATSSYASVTSDTYDPVPANNVEAVTITVLNPPAKVNAATVPMQHTGVPIAGLILAILAVFAGLVMPKRK